MWLKLPNGLLIQWNTTSVWGTFTYPKAFKDNKYSLISSFGINSNNWGPEDSSVTARKISNMQGNIWSYERTNGYWLAIGY